MDHLGSQMVDELVRSRSITTPRIEAAFRSTPRQLFLPGVDPEVVYRDDPVPIKHGTDGLPTSSSSQPAVMATMLEQLELSRGHSVLEIGTGSGYNAALLGAIVGDGGRVRTMDIDDELVADAQRHLRSAGVSNVQATAADGWSGFEADAPYDRIEVTVGIWDISLAWVDQLASDGVIVVPLWLRAGVQASIAFRRDAHDLVSINAAPCGFLQLRGPHAGPEAYVPVDGWALCEDAADSPQREQVLRLLASPATVSEAPHLPDGWFTQVALTHPAPIRMWTTQGPWLERQGIMLPDRSGLAVTEGDRVLTFGDPTARDELLRVASASDGDLEHVTIRAHPTTDPTDAHGAVQARPAFTYSFEW